MESEGSPVASEFSGEVLKQLYEAAKSVYRAWDESWPAIQASIESEGQEIQCQRGCNVCCYTQFPCTISEGLSVIQYMSSEFSAGRQEYFRTRVESAASSLQRLRMDEHGESDDDIWACGGMECPFIDAGECAIYPVRPLDCRFRYLSGNMNPEQCRRRSNAFLYGGAQQMKSDLLDSLTGLEKRILIPPALLQEPILSLPERLSRLWEKGAPACSLNFTPEAWKLRLASRNTSFDETWQDDRTDFRVLTFPLSLPEEGDYHPDYTLVKLRFESHPIYDRCISGETLPDFLTFYKRNPECVFDWKNRQFVGSKEDASVVPYTVWMSDGPQERLMMWEAAKRVRGRVLCGGLGLGIFPQLALAFPGVESIDIVELDPNIGRMISDAWQKHPWPRMDRCRVISNTIEDHLNSTNEKYDSVYIDTWDAIYHEYLPHLNYLRFCSEKVLKPGGQILLWAYDMMVRQFLSAVRLIIDRREKYLAMNRRRSRAMSTLYPLLHQLVSWLQENKNCSNEALMTRAYRMATRENRNLGVLKLITQPGASDLLVREYFETDG